MLGHADALSRLSLPDPAVDPAPSHHVLLLQELSWPPVWITDVAVHTAKDHMLARVFNSVWKGWPDG